MSANIGRCIWKTDEQGNPDFSIPKIDSQVATDDNRDELMAILQSGIVEKTYKSRYANNYRLFQRKIQELSDSKDFLGGYDKNSPQVQNEYSRLPNRILNNCILLPIQASSQDAALRIFSTLNDRGKPLSDSDIFKVQLYKAFAAEGQKDYFIEQWLEFEAVCEKIFSSLKISSPIDELFNRYMYYERADAHIKDSTKEGLRSCYENFDKISKKTKDRLLRTEHRRVFENLIALADFWNAVADQDEDRFSQRVLKRLFVLDYAPNSAWTIITSVYFMHNKRPDGTLDEERFYIFLGKITAFIWSSAIIGSSVNHLRTPLYREMVSIISGSDITFEGYKFDFDELKSRIQKFPFSGRTKITRSVLAWWAMQDHQQPVLPLATVFETEHISKKGKTINPSSYEMLGNNPFLRAKLRVLRQLSASQKRENTMTVQHPSRKNLQSFMNCLYSLKLKAASTSQTSTSATKNHRELHELCRGK